MNLSISDATILLGGLSAIVIPFIINWLPTIKVSDYIKFGILCLLSLIGGFLTAYISGGINWSGSIISTASTILVAAQVFYYTAFRALGLEKVLFPKQALINEAKTQSTNKTNVETISNTTAKDLLDPATNSALVITSTQVTHDRLDNTHTI